MIDIAQQIGAINRQVAIATVQDTESVVVTAERRYPAEVTDVWSALTDPERIRRWFMPISGDLTEGGQFQLEGNASGDILTCQPTRIPERDVRQPGQRGGGAAHARPARRRC